MFLPFLGVFLLVTCDERGFTILHGLAGWRYAQVSAARVENQSRARMTLWLLQSVRCPSISRCIPGSSCAPLRACTMDFDDPGAPCLERHAFLLSTVFLPEKDRIFYTRAGALISPYIPHRIFRFFHAPLTAPSAVAVPPCKSPHTLGRG